MSFLLAMDSGILQSEGSSRMMKMSFASMRFATLEAEFNSTRFWASMDLASATAGSIGLGTFLTTGFSAFFLAVLFSEVFLSAAFLSAGFFSDGDLSALPESSVLADFSCSAFFGSIATSPWRQTGLHHNPKPAWPALAKSRRIAMD